MPIPLHLPALLALIAPTALCPRSYPLVFKPDPQNSTYHFTYFHLRPKQTQRPYYPSSPYLFLIFCLSHTSLLTSLISLSCLSLCFSFWFLFPFIIPPSQPPYPTVIRLPSSHFQIHQEHVREIQDFWVGVQIELRPQETYVLINLNLGWQMTCAEWAGDTGTGALGKTEMFTH